MIDNSRTSEWNAISFLENRNVPGSLLAALRKLFGPRSQHVSNVIDIRYRSRMLFIESSGSGGCVVVDYTHVSSNIFTSIQLYVIHRNRSLESKLRPVFFNWYLTLSDRS